jgi:hypothetical protein
LARQRGFSTANGALVVNFYLAHTPALSAKQESCFAEIERVKSAGYLSRFGER